MQDSIGGGFVGSISRTAREGITDISGWGRQVEVTSRWMVAMHPVD